MKICSGGELESVVPVWRPGVHHHCLCHGVNNGTGSWLPLLRARTQKVSTFTDMGVYGGRDSHHFPMVLLGLFAGFQPVRNQWLHWRPSKVWFNEDLGSS